MWILDQLVLFCFNRKILISPEQSHFVMKLVCVVHFSWFFIELLRTGILSLYFWNGYVCFSVFLQWKRVVLTDWFWRTVEMLKRRTFSSCWAYSELLYKRSVIHFSKQFLYEFKGLSIFFSPTKLLVTTLRVFRKRIIFQWTSLEKKSHKPNISPECFIACRWMYCTLVYPNPNPKRDLLPKSHSSQPSF